MTFQDPWEPCTILASDRRTDTWNCSS